MSNHKPTPRPTIGSLTKEIMGLVWIIIKICVSYIEDFTREILNLAISQDTIQSEHEESRERAVHFADGFHDGDWQGDDISKDIYMEQDWNGGSTNSHLNSKPIYDGLMNEVED